MKLLKKASALLITSAIVFSSAQVSLTASAESIEEAVQAAIAIANDDSHGYDFNNRWGPDYDCSSFVLTSLKRAGFDIGDAVGTQTMKRGLTKKGWKWYPWSEIHSLEDLRRGDILLNESTHTEFYIGRGQNCGAHWNYNNPQTGDQNGHEIDVCAYYDNPWDGVLRYTNDIPKVKPTDVEITAGTTACAADQTVHFEFFSINSAEQYIDIYKDNKRVQHLDVTNKYEYDMKFSEGGTYTYKLTAKNMLGEVTTKAQNIRVYKYKPENVYVTTDKTIYAKGDTITYTFGAKNATEMYLYPGFGDSVNVTGKTSYTAKAENTGYYYISLYTYNPAGYADAYGRNFEVYDKKPEYVYLNGEDSEIPAGDSTKFSFGSSYAVEQSLVIEKDGKQFDKINVTNKTSQEITFDKGGTYNCYLTAKNKFGETKSSKLTLNVYSSVPKNVNGYTYNTMYRVGEEVQFSLEAEHEDRRSVRIYQPNGKTRMLNAGTKNYVTTTFDEEGEYYYSIGAVNRFGETFTEKKKLIISNGGSSIERLASDKPFYKTGDTVHLYFDVKNASSATLSIQSGDGVFSDYVDVTGKNEYTFKATQSGYYSCGLSADNGNGGSAGYYTIPVNDNYSIRYESNDVYYYYNESEYTLGTPAAVNSELNDQIPEDSEFKLAGWSTVEGANTAQYKQGSEYAGSGDVVLYAVWTNSENADRAAEFKRIEWEENTGKAYGVFEITEGEEVIEERLPAEVTINSSDSSCTIQGKITYTAAVTYQGTVYSDTRSEDVGRSGHDYTLRKWEWNGTDSAKATFICENDSDHKKTVNAEITKSLSKDGKTIEYKAAAEIDGHRYVSTKTAPAGRLGDVDDDGSITSADALKVLRISVSLETASANIKTLADIDGDGTITSADALEVLRSSVGLNSNPKIGKAIG